MAFAREEKFLARIPQQMLDTYYQSVILPAKLRLDGEYMAEATFSSDLKLIVASALRRWDNKIWLHLPYNEKKLRQQVQTQKTRTIPNYAYTPLEPSNSLQ